MDVLTEQGHKKKKNSTPTPLEKKMFWLQLKDLVTLLKKRLIKYHNQPQKVKIISVEINYNYFIEINQIIHLMSI